MKRSRLKEIILEILNEIEFADAAEFKKYNAKHKMRASTKVKIGDKETTAGDASGKKKVSPKKAKKMVKNVVNLRKELEQSQKYMDKMKARRDWKSDDREEHYAIVDDLEKAEKEAEKAGVELPKKEKPYWMSDEEPSKTKPRYGLSNDVADEIDDALRDSGDALATMDDFNREERNRLSDKERDLIFKYADDMEGEEDGTKPEGSADDSRKRLKKLLIKAKGGDT